MAIENRTLEAGTVLVATYKKVEHRCEVLKTEQGIAFQLADGKVFMSPSSAGKAITGRVSCDGWKFWSVASGTQPAAATSAETASTEPATAKTPKAKPAAKPAAPKMVKLIKKLPNQQAVPEGSTKFWCSACMKAFVAETTLVPETCPAGHPREAADEFAAVPQEAAEANGDEEGTLRTYENFPRQALLDLRAMRRASHREALVAREIHQHLRGMLRESTRLSE
jgi:hypothetical protein